MVTGIQAGRWCYLHISIHKAPAAVTVTAMTIQTTIRFKSDITMTFSSMPFWANRLFFIDFIPFYTRGEPNFGFPHTAQT